MKKYLLSLPIFLMTFFSCDYLDKEPIGQVIPETASDFRALMTTAYNRLPEHKKLLTVRTDELDLDPFAIPFDSYRDIAIWNDVTPDWKTYAYPWVSIYNTIFYANHVINEGPNVKSDPSESMNQLIAEAYALRAYMHFELLNMYAVPYNKETASTDRGIPLSTRIDIEQEYVPARVQEVYDQILTDLEYSEELMEVKAQPEAVRYRFSEVSVKALQARVALYQNEWSRALDYAKKVLEINPTLINLNETLLSPAHHSSKECILAMERVTTADMNGILNDGRFSYPDFSISSTLSNCYDQTNDLRFGLYFYRGYPAKFKSAYDRMTFRVAEFYLIAAEASAQLGDEAAAKAYLEQLAVNRLNPEGYTAYSTRLETLSGKALLEEIADERMRELALEGHRWYDLRRTSRKAIRKVFMDMNTWEDVVYDLNENDVRYTLRIPKEAIENNPNLQD